MAQQFPAWLRRPWGSGSNFEATRETMSDLKLHTVCQSAHCPNIGECWANRTATVMVLGNTCTRNCAFCSVYSGAPLKLDPAEPNNVAEAVARMGLRHAVVTTVVRDDLPDGGASHIAETVRQIRAKNPDTTVEVLVSDFFGNADDLGVLLASEPEVFGHNIETVRRLYPTLRDRRFTYDGALECLADAARVYGDRAIIKSAMMVGHGETDAEVYETLADLRAAKVDVVCIGQYLRPTARQREVEAFIPPDRFVEYEARAYELGFEFVVSGPFVRSSYRSELVLDQPFARARLGLPALATAGEEA